MRESARRGNTGDRKARYYACRWVAHGGVLQERRADRQCEGGAGNLDELGLFAGQRETFVLEKLLEIVHFELVEISC